MTSPAHPYRSLLLAACVVSAAACSKSSSPGAPAIPGDCLPFPAEMLGTWGTVAGLEVSCGGITGACSVRRTERKALVTISAPNLVADGAAAAKPACLKKGKSKFGEAYFLDCWPGDAVRLLPNGTLDRSRNRVEATGHTYVRLDGAPAPSTVPAWAVGDFTVGDGPAMLRTGANGVWALQGGGGLRDLHLGKIGAAASGKPTCIGLNEPERIGGAQGELCHDGDEKTLTFVQTAPVAATTKLTLVPEK